MKNILSAFAAFFIAAPAFAYLTATGSSKIGNTSVRTHILIVGNGSELGNALSEAAAAQAKKYDELYPNEQVYLISVNNLGGSRDATSLQLYGYHNIVEKGGSFTSADVLSEMMAFKKIASVDIFSHSVAYYGVILDGKLNRLDPKADGYQRLQGHFTEDAFAFLHGCNSGEFLAGIFSYQWGIPVAGSFTGTAFQHLYENKGFFNDDARKPKDSVKVKVNRQSYDKNYGCYSGACSRLFPDNVPYNGYWGTFSEGGLGFYKWLCVNNSITPERCFKTMARAALTYVSIKNLSENSSLEDYKDVVLDYLCPSSKRAECRVALEHAVATGKMEYDPFNAKSLQCDFKGCKAKFTCERIPFIDLLRSGSCTVENLRPSNKTTTMADEYLAYLKGYRLLQAELSARR